MTKFFLTNKFFLTKIYAAENTNMSELENSQGSCIHIGILLRKY